MKYIIMELTLERLTKQYGNKIAVDRLDMNFKTGVYGLLGSNGAGKTTLMRMICGILNPSSGEVKLDGSNILKMGETYRDKLGYLPQNFGYYPDFTAKDYMLYIAALKGIAPGKAKNRTDELMELVGLKDVMKKQIKTYSGGMKQRLGIAQAMINNPSILILDEPTAGLDPKERVRFRNLISDFAADRLVILSTHIVSDIEYIANEILVMKKGTFIVRGTLEELINIIMDKVWEVTVDQGTADRLCEKYAIINLRHVNQGVELRIVDEKCPMPGAVHVKPTLEDLYLYEFSDEDNIMGAH